MGCIKYFPFSQCAKIALHRREYTVDFTPSFYTRTMPFGEQNLSIGAQDFSSLQRSKCKFFSENFTSNISFAAATKLRQDAGI